MTLTTHAIAGAAIAASMPHHLIIGFALAFASHFVLDAIPHWDYQLRSYKKDETNRLNDDMPINRDFFIDLLHIGIDMSCGIIIVLLFFTLSGAQLFWAPFVGVFGGVLPDALQFAYWKWRHEPLTSLQRFHIWVDHPERNLHHKPLVGVPFQIAVAVIIIAASRLL
ncbi:MAG: hypothetical protein P4L61_01645 [Candidatus Pacebacteria bacterium]|nr:hypothetical protein [Candidatus Paceibacterota bacterium]